LRVSRDAERLGQGGGARTGARHEEDARCVLVEPMDEARLVLEPEAQRLGQAVDMPRLAAAALRRQAGAACSAR
jgi:hypothetical protein